MRQQLKSITVRGFPTIKYSACYSWKNDSSCDTKTKAWCW